MAPAIIVPAGISGGSYQIVGATAGGGGGGSSVWGDHGTFMSLTTTTQANDTASLNISSNNWSTVRGTQGYSTGKHYFEVKVLTTGGDFDVGLIDATTANGAGLDDRLAINIVTNSQFNGASQNNGSGLAGVNIGSALGAANNDIFGVAFDATNGFHYLALNNTWFLSGDPTSGATGTGHVGSYSTVRTYYPAISLWGLIGGVMQIKTSGLTYAVPSGYTAWG